MSKNIRKILASIVGISMLFTLIGCGKDNSAEESLRAELESLREQAEETEEAEETEATDEEPEETEAEVEETEDSGALELREWDRPFSVADESYNLAPGQIAGNGTFYYTLAGVRELNSYQSSLEGTYYANEIPEVPAGQVVVHPLIQIYNGSANVEEYDPNLITLYVDNVQATVTDTGYSTNDYWIDGLEQLIYTELDPGETSIIVSAFNVPSDWSTLTVFYGDASWTITHDEVLSAPYEYTNLFDPNETIDITEPGTEIFSNDQFSVTYDGYEIYQEGLRFPCILFEYTISNSTDSILNLNLPNNMRAYYQSRLMDNATSVIDEPVNGYNNINIQYSYGDNTFEIHPGMSTKVFAAYFLNEETGVFEMYFETSDYGILAHVSVMVE